MARIKRKPAEYQETSYWQSYSDMMAGVLLMFILIICGTLFVLMQVKNSYDASAQALEVREAELEAAMNENEDYLDLTDAQQAQLDAQQSRLDEQEQALADAQALLEEQQAALAASQEMLAAQASQIDEQEDALESQQQQLQDIIGVKKELVTALNEAFADTDLSISVDEQTGAITMAASVMFDYDSAELSDAGKQTLSEFLPQYFEVVLGEDYRDYISEIIIEGHTDVDGTYERNLELSQSRAESVAMFCLSDDQDMFSADMLEQIRTLVSVSGRAWNEPVYAADGTVDSDASRRVEIKFRLSDEEMIDQMISVLDDYGN